MTQTVYASNRDFLILTHIKVVSGTTQHFTPDTKHVGKFAVNTLRFLAKAFPIVHEQIYKSGLFFLLRLVCLLATKNSKVQHLEDVPYT